jgi:16S rRNA (adenine1518-N6/adenine1519-N6)-dimethyltransferase
MYPKPKKSLGQNFLIDQNIQRKIINACLFNPSDIILEIGAGRGELTGLIADRVKRIYAFEIDSSLCAILKDNLKKHTNVTIANQDILKCNFKKYFPGLRHKIKVFGNIPYYITTPILEYLLRYQEKISDIFITVQKEFARRMTAHPGSKDYGAFSCFIQYYTQPQIIFTIKKTCFRPMPKVDSCFLRLEIKKQYSLKSKSEKLLFKIIRAAFQQRRKTLRNSLKGIIAPSKLAKFFLRYNLDPNIRPEDLSLENFLHLAR